MGITIPTLTTTKQYRAMRYLLLLSITSQLVLTTAFFTSCPSMVGKTHMMGLQNKNRMDGFQISMAETESQADSQSPIETNVDASTSTTNPKKNSKKKKNNLCVGGERDTHTHTHTHTHHTHTHTASSAH